MSAMDHDSWNIDIGVVVLLAELAFILVEKFGDELIDLISIEIRWVFCLLEEKGCWVFKFFHLIQK
jgi:hypothetical protein